MGKTNTTAKTRAHEDSTALTGEASHEASQIGDVGNQGDLEEQVACRYLLHHVHRNLHLHEQLEPKQHAVGEEGDDRQAQQHPDPPQQDCDMEDEHHRYAHPLQDSTASACETSHRSSQDEEFGNQGALEE